MKLDKLIKELEKCYDKKQQAFFCSVPSNFANDILNYLKEYKKLKQTLAEIKELCQKHINAEKIVMADDIIQKISECG